jgi:hypothetical protein
MEKWKEQRERWLADHGTPPEGGPDDLPEMEFSRLFL